MFRILLFVALVAAPFLFPRVVAADDLLAEVPQDALGFVVVNNLEVIDAKVDQLAKLLGRELPRPLAVLREFAGVGAGFNSSGSAMLVLFPSGEQEQPFEYCLWLPVSDYESMLKSLNATTIDGVAAASIAGEDLVLARRGEWVLVMDPDQRDRIAQLADASPAPPEMPAWKSWISQNDVTIVAFPSGFRELLELGGVVPVVTEVTPAAQANSPTRDTDINRRGGGPQAVRTPAEFFENAKNEVKKWIAVAPQILENLPQVRTAAFGLRLDGSNNAVASVRLVLPQGMSKVSTDSSTTVALPLSLYEGGGFILNAVGSVPPAVLAGYVDAYARRLAADLRDEERTVLDESAFARLMQAAEQACAEVQSFAVLDQPGEERQPVYSNQFASVRVANRSKFLEQAREVMRLWNSASRDAKGETRMVFDVEETQVGERPATLYSLDIGALDGGAVAPEVRQAMEKMFGPQGKLRLWIVPTDEHTVLLAAATPDQMTAVLKTIDQKRPIEWNRGEVSESNALLPADADVRAFVDLHRYFDWKRREMMAIIGVPVIGGPLVREFPASPPVGIACVFRDGELRLDAAVLAPTIKSADGYFSVGRNRGTIRVRQPVVPVPRAR
jgi:hypothetical protein